MAPPRPNAGPARLSASPLPGSKVVLAGQFRGCNHAQIARRIQAVGGDRRNGVEDDTLVVIATEEDFRSNSVKCQAALSRNIPIVELDWLKQCEEMRVIPDFDPFRLGDQKAVQATVDPVTRPDPTPLKRQSNSRKRAAQAPDDSNQDRTVKKQKESSNGDEKPISTDQYARSLDLVVPLDESCQYAGYQVYIDPATRLIYDANLTFSNHSHNNNKFYKIQLVFHPKSQKYHVWARYGRVGELGVNQGLGNGSVDDAVKVFEKKFRDKTGIAWKDRDSEPKTNKYFFAQQAYEGHGGETENMDGGGSVVAECTLDKPVQDFISLISDDRVAGEAMKRLRYDAQRLPLLRLSKSVILSARKTLKNLSELNNDQSLAASTYSTTYARALEDLSNRYYTYIPHILDRKEKIVLLSTDDLIKQETILLDSLDCMKDGSDIMKEDGNKRVEKAVHRLDRLFQKLDLVEFTTLDRQSQEFSELAAYLCGTRGSTHHFDYTIEDIFRMERAGERTRFDGFELAENLSSNRRLLWHGSPCCNFVGILKKGLYISPPEAVTTGAMFGKGVYLADMSSKSAAYCRSEWTGNTGLLLLCEAELGFPMMERTTHLYNAHEVIKTEGKATTLGKGGTGPTKWKDAACIHPSLAGVQMPDTSVPPGRSHAGHTSLCYNEYIVYSTAQVRLRYVFRVKMR